MQLQGVFMTDINLKSNDRRMRILLVEDNHGDVVLLKHGLQQSKIEAQVNIASTGEEALKLLQSNHLDRAELPDLILLDINLPGINGVEVLTRIKSNAYLKEIPIVVISSSNANEDKTNCFRAHANYYLVKASNIDEVGQFIANLERFWFRQRQL